MEDNQEKVLIVGTYDPAGQGYLTAKAMRDHLGWDAHCVITQETWLQYETDWVLGKNKMPEDIQPFVDEATFFIFIDAHQALPGVDWSRVNPRNNVIWGLGSPLRSNTDKMLMYQLRTGQHITMPPQTTTMFNRVLSDPLDTYIVDTEVITNLAAGQVRNEVPTVCQAVVNRNRGTDLVEQAISQLKSEGLEVEFDFITGVSWREAIRRKAKASITFDTVLYPEYGLNVLEGLFLGHHVISCLSPWCYAVYPDLPITQAKPTMESIKECIKVGLMYPQPATGTDNMFDKWTWQQAWVIQKNSPTSVATKWQHYIEYVKGE